MYNIAMSTWDDTTAAGNAITDLNGSCAPTFH